MTVWVLLVSLVLHLLLGNVNGSQLQNLINFVRGDGQPLAGRSAADAGRSAADAGRSAAVLALAAPSAQPQAQYVPPPIPFAGVYTYVEAIKYC